MPSSPLADCAWSRCHFKDPVPFLNGLLFTVFATVSESCRSASTAPRYEPTAKAFSPWLAAAQALEAAPRPGGRASG